VTVPASLRVPELDPLWALARARLEARGGDSRGRLRVPALSLQAKLALKALVGGLVSALSLLDHHVSAEPARRRAERAERQQARRDAREIADGWPEPWAPAWIDEAIRAGILRGLDQGQVRNLLRQVRAVLLYLDRDAPAPISRVDLAAQVLGSAHALDTGTRVERAVARALAHKHGAGDHRELWAQAGVHFDLTSAPALTWALPLSDGCGLARVAATAREAAIPLHLSRLALDKYPAIVPSGCHILVVENPRLVEAAVQKRAATPVISTNGQPSSTVLLLLMQLLQAGAELHYHGDFDTAGLAICARLMRLGLRPWRMDSAHYLAALAAADAEGAVLPIETDGCGPTPWDDTLREVFDRERRIVHQERLLQGLIM
jgi:uncharacterized protein (TIGR02679 family)